MSLTSFWCPCYYIQTHFTSCSSIFSVFIVNLKNPGWVVGVTVPENRAIVLLLFIKNVEKLLTILTRISILRPVTGCWNILCLLQMTVNATLWHVFVPHQVEVLLMGVFVKHLFATVPMTSPMGCFSQIFVYNLLWRRHF